MNTKENLLKGELRGRVVCFAHSKHNVWFESLSASTQPSNHPSGLTCFSLRRLPQRLANLEGRGGSTSFTAPLQAVHSFVSMIWNSDSAKDQI